MSMTIDQEEKVISSLAEMGVTFPVSIKYPTGRITYVSRIRYRKEVIVLPKKEERRKKAKGDNLIIFPSKFNLEPA